MERMLGEAGEEDDGQKEIGEKKKGRIREIRRGMGG